ncbi:MAG: hypothetical protein JW779_11705 [Candidatus Thorarchaeota archaeon]|nr:hypothetical protein [Candidatus Thorarchaeota archaeon]
MKKIELVPLLLLSIILIPGYVSASNASMSQAIAVRSMHQISDTDTDLSGITVGIYESYFSYVDPRVNESRKALENMFTWMNATVIKFNTTELLNGAIWGCELLAIPEGLGPTIEYRLTDDGIELIRDWVALGGSYIGVRGSAAIAVRDSYFELSNTTFNLALINGTSIEVTDLPDEVMTNVSINHGCAGPDLSDMPANLSVLFETGRYFVPDEDQEVLVIANYTHSNLPAMIAAEYGEGNLFISSPHFEYEENSDRDGTDYMDSFDDPDSEWPLLQQISCWLIDNSPTVRNTTWGTTDTLTDSEIPTAVIIGSVGVLAILIIVIIAKKRAA